MFPFKLPQSHHHGLQREACWVLSNIAGTPGRGGLEALKGAGAVPVRMQGTPPPALGLLPAGPCATLLAPSAAAMHAA